MEPPETAQAHATTQRIALRTADQVIVSTRNEQAIADGTGVSAVSMALLPNGADTHQRQWWGPDVDATALVFLGNLYYRPNSRAVEDIRDTIVPPLRADGLFVQTRIVGQGPAHLAHDAQDIELPSRAPWGSQWPRDLDNHAGCTIGMPVEHGYVEDSTTHHELNLVFEVTLPAARPTSREDHLEFRWLPLDQLADADVRPGALRDALIAGRETHTPFDTAGAAESSAAAVEAPERLLRSARSASGAPTLDGRMSPMARRSSTTTTPPPPDDDFEERIVDVDVSEEMRGSYLEYAYSVIYQRALPDARDGLKPVQRRILHQMADMGLRPDRGYVKSSRVVGDVMGKLHPHGDSPIYDSLVRMAQSFSMRVPLVDGHGNFGSLGGDDAPAAMRYTECRMTPAAGLMVESIGEDVVDFHLNYDGREHEPDVLPSAFPNLLVNGSSGIAVGMATNMAPHNLAEVIAAARHLIKHPDATVDDLMRFVPGPDLPTGGTIAGLAGVREAYEAGRGTFRTRATTTIENITARRKGIVVTQLPYTVGPEKVISKIKELVTAKKLSGITDLKDLTDRANGLRLVIEVKSGYNPEAVLSELHRLTPMEESFGINNVTLVDGQPRTLGLKDLLRVYLDHRFNVVRRRCLHRRAKREERAHLIDGLLIALLDIDEVIATIRASEDTADARQRLIAGFELSEAQATYILDTPLRRLTKYDRLELERERETLRAEIDELTAILDSDERLRQVVSDELAHVAKRYSTPRRTVLLEEGGRPATSVPLEVSDDPCRVLLSATGLLARTTSAPPADAPRAGHDAVVAGVPATVRGAVGAVTSAGRLLRLDVQDLPSLPGSGGMAGGAPTSEFVDLGPDERVVAMAHAYGGDDAEARPGLALATAQGIVKRVTSDYPQNRDEFEVISLKDGDRVVGAIELATGEEEFVFVTTDAQLLRFDASAVRPQGRTAAGVAGVKLAQDAGVIFFGAVAGEEADVVTVAGSAGALPGAQQGGAKVTPLREYPAKGRATGGVRCQRFLKGEDALLRAWVGASPRATTSSGEPVELPDPAERRDASGAPLSQAVEALGGAASPVTG